MLALMQKYDIKNHFIFDPFHKAESNWNFTSCEMPHFMITISINIFINLSWIKNNASQKHAYIILIPLNPTFI